jgi:hypothetical protein
MMRWAGPSQRPFKTNGPVPSMATRAPRCGTLSPCPRDSSLSDPNLTNGSGSGSCRCSCKHLGKSSAAHLYVDWRRHGVLRAYGRDGDGLQTSRVENATPVVVTGSHVWSNPMRACWGPEEGEGKKTSARCHDPNYRCAE